jgi:xanthine dehydrogenase accessory factor
MQDIQEQLQAWVDMGHEIALATVVSTWGSSPRPAGARMAVRADGTMAGSVSGGCVEGAVVQAGLEILAGATSKLLHFGVADETAWEVGLACGGSIEVFVQPFEPSLLGSLREGQTARISRVMTTVISGPERMLGAIGIFDAEGLLAGTVPDEIKADVDGWVAAALKRDAPTREQVEIEGQPAEIFIDPLPPSPTIIMIGGVHISIGLAEMASLLGYRTIVIDPRKRFASMERFPGIDQLIQRWPSEALEEVGIDKGTAVAVLTHDPKIDDPALIMALRSPAFYIGALGSRTTHAKRMERLRQAGLTNEMLARLRAPIGLDIGARTPKEIGLSILAEITAARHGKSGTSH